MSLEKDVDRGRLAEEVLHNPVYADAYELIEQGIYEKWRESSDPLEREQLHKLLALVSKARKLMESTMRSGQLAKAELERKRSVAERIGLRRG